MMIEEQKALAYKLYSLLKDYDFVDFQRDDEENSFLELDNVCFYFDKDGKIIKVDVNL